MIFFAFVAFGILVGMAAQWLIPGTSAGIVLDVVVGVIGSVVGGWLYIVWQHAGTTALNLPSFAYALVGAVLLIWITRTLGAGGVAR